MLRAEPKHPRLLRLQEQRGDLQRLLGKLGEKLGEIEVVEMIVGSVGPFFREFRVNANGIVSVQGGECMEIMCRHVCGSAYSMS